MASRLSHNVQTTNTEFVRSSDNWFRPVNFINAPDGTLYVLDMSREIIESNNIPLDVAKYLDLRNGRDQGRIYRLAPPGFHSPKPPRLGDATTAELVATLEDPNGWWRDTAHRLIHERQDKSCVPALRALFTKSADPCARVLALWSLQGLAESSDEDIELRFPIHRPRFVSMQSVWPNHDWTLRPSFCNVFCLWATTQMRVFAFSLRSH